MISLSSLESSPFVVGPVLKCFECVCLNVFTVIIMSKHSTKDTKINLFGMEQRIIDLWTRAVLPTFLYN